MLINSRVRLVKLFLHITPDEQVCRFRDRLVESDKALETVYEEFRNRARW